MRTFDTGATRDTAEGKPDYAGYLSPLVIKRFGQYMMKHQKQADGQVRPSDNWKKGIPVAVYLSSKFRHFVDTWSAIDKDAAAVYAPDIEETLCGELFNTMGLLHEILKRSLREGVPVKCDSCKYGLGAHAECSVCVSNNMWKPQADTKDAPQRMCATCGHKDSGYALCRGCVESNYSNWIPKQDITPQSLRDCTDCLYGHYYDSLQCRDCYTTSERPNWKPLDA